MSVKSRIDSNFLYYYNEGKSLNSYEIFGSHLVYDKNHNPIGCEFALLAPNAKSVQLIGSFNNFERDKIYLEKIDDFGVWYYYYEGDILNASYKYIITTKDGKELIKADPYAFCSDLRPLTNSKVYDITGYKWNDDVWMYTRPKTYELPVLIYELHLGSWQRTPEGEFLNYVDIAERLVHYLKDFGYTHVEIMPMYEHPLDASWGYQGTSYYSPTSRFGTPHELMQLIDILHQNGYGVIMDWVPGHICKDAHGLYLFDGTPLYDYASYEYRENLEWGTANLDLGKGLTRSFLYSNAMYYLKYFHVDGFRVDAVSNIIYHLGNTNIGENRGAIEFIKDLSNILFAYDDRILFMAEDSSQYPGVTKPSGMGGLGFNYKWDMGWMNDTLSYFKLDPIFRKYHHDKITFSMMYYYNEQYVLTFSHDEVVHMKGSLLNKMPGDYWQKFANYRLLLGYMLTHPGKKLLFMGSEFAPFSEWAYAKELDWHLYKYPSHDAFARYFKEFSKLYKEEKSLWELDYSYDGFKYIEADNKDQSLFIFARYAKDKKDHVVVVMNCTPNTYFSYRIGVPGNHYYYELMNSDKDIYGGSNKVNPKKLRAWKGEAHNQTHHVDMTIPPLGIVVLKNIPMPPRKKKTIK